MNTPKFFGTDKIDLNDGSFGLSFGSNTNIFGKPINDNIYSAMDCPPPLFSNRKFVEMEYQFPEVEKIVVPLTECVIIENNNQSIIDKVYLQNESIKNHKIKVLLDFIHSFTKQESSILVDSFCASLKSLINFYIAHDERMKKGMIPHSQFLIEKEREELCKYRVEYFINSNELMKQFDFVYRVYYENLKEILAENFSDIKLIDYLYEKALEFDLDTESTSFISKKILSMTFEPYSYFLYRWIFHGELLSVQNDYFIQVLGTTFSIKENAPVFIKRIKEVIFKCGILVQLMKHIDKICQTTYFLPTTKDLNIYWRLDSIMLEDNISSTLTTFSFIPIDVAIEKCLVRPIRDHYEYICYQLSHLLLNRNMTSREINQLVNHQFGHIFGILIDLLQLISQENMPLEAKIVRLSSKIISTFSNLSVHNFINFENNMVIEQDI